MGQNLLLFNPVIICLKTLCCVWCESPWECQIVCLILKQLVFFGFSAAEKGAFMSLFCPGIFPLYIYTTFITSAVASIPLCVFELMHFSSFALKPCSPCFCQVILLSNEALTYFQIHLCKLPIIIHTLLNTSIWKKEVHCSMLLIIMVIIYFKWIYLTLWHIIAC